MAYPDGYNRTLTIPTAGGAVASNSHQLMGHSTPIVPTSFAMPANLRGTTTIKIQVSQDDSTWFDIFDDGAVVTITTTISTVFPVPDVVQQGCVAWGYMRVVADANPNANLAVDVHFAAAGDDSPVVPGKAGIGSQGATAVTNPASSASVIALLKGLLTSRTVKVRATLNGSSPGTLAAAGDYAAGDVLNESATTGHAWIAPSIARNAGEGGLIRKVLVTLSVAAVTARLRLHIWNAVPTVLQNDNVALLLDLDDRASYLGFIDLPALATSGSSEFAFAENDQLAHMFQTNADANLYFVVQTLDSFTNESAGMTMDIFISAERE